ncbi:hypothetical protein [Shewanella fidelis]|uniref:Uncharacterized protein n=1 Tax=Shewanella fidelis TaxID=173509 RepID=A0AAW8NLE5_9GAMM|nr:hypothetical protein [Shewanella fidelis]MDR8522639.1 hypothetical protein [Shewanella fidelis]MDW4812255.1 hypothetical protein [Shewanella fidelis]MDW4816081.1 hypothetical protein [Shewanella fidelis]MDW4820496.1 hypothetical protein [Shewanella fidelis]MDW4824718.1 hypothetical protein [Shewanella fidelis]
MIKLTNQFPGRVSMFENGSFIGNGMTNPLGNSMSFTDAHGAFAGHDTENVFGGVNHFDSNGQFDGFTRPNVFGGVDRYNANGQFSGHTVDTAFGVNHYDNQGGLEASYIGDFEANDNLTDSILNFMNN